MFARLSSWPSIAQGSHFKTPRSSAQFQDTKCEGRSNKTQNHFDLLGNWTPVIYMTVNNLTTIPLSTAWYAWRLFWSVEGQAPELVKWSNPKGQILRSDENANVPDFGYQFDRQTHLPHVNFLIDSEGLHKISKIFVGLNAFCSINKYDIFFPKIFTWASSSLVTYKTPDSEFVGSILGTATLFFYLFLLLLHCESFFTLLHTLKVPSHQ